MQLELQTFSVRVDSSFVLLFSGPEHWRTCGFHMVRISSVLLRGFVWARGGRILGERKSSRGIRWEG